MTDEDRAVALLDDLSPRDPEQAHIDADDLLLGCVPDRVAEAYERAAERIGFWYA